MNIDFDIKNDGDEDNPDGYTPIELAEKRNSIIIKKLLGGEFTPRKRPPTDNDIRILEAVKVGDLKRVLIEQDPYARRQDVAIHYDVVHARIRTEITLARNKHNYRALHVVLIYNGEGHYDIVEVIN